MGIRKEYKKYFGRQIKDECVHNAEDVIEFAKHYQALSQEKVINSSQEKVINSSQEKVICPHCND